MFLKEAVTEHNNNDNFKDIEEAIHQLAMALDPIAPSDDLRTRILADLPVKKTHLFSTFAPQIAKLFQVTEERAQIFLDLLGEPAAWLYQQGIGLMHVPAGPALAQADVGFISLKPKQTFPRHRHRGEEMSLVIQGSYQDGDLVVCAGESQILAAGSTHHFTALPGPDCIFAAVVMIGIEFIE